MAEDVRNFRAYYYDKFGFRGVEEKKSIEILLKEKSLDLAKLSEFCIRFPVPAMHRFLVWKVMLGVLPPYYDIHEFVLEQRRQQYEDLNNCLRVTKRIGDIPKPEIFLRMFLLETGNWKLEDESQFLDPESQQFVSIALAFSRMFTDDLDVYWLTRNFFKARSKFKGIYSSLYDSFVQLFQKEDSELHGHLVSIGALQSLPVQKWFGNCFAGTLHTTSLEKIWDKVIGGSVKILPFVLVSTLTTCRHTLLYFQVPQDVNKYIFMLSEETSELIANQAIELWKKYGYQLP